LEREIRAGEVHGGAEKEGSGGERIGMADQRGDVNPKRSPKK
jgi:hypothetical protein